MKYLIVILISLIFSCSPFETRTPEEPDSGSSNFIPPTSPDIVISNLIESITSKNIENYALCFNSSQDAEDVYFVFYPSSDAINKFPNIFSSWTIDDEKRYFLSVVSILPDNIKPQIMFNSPEFESITPDSAIYVTDYELIVPNNENFPENYYGHLQFTLVPESNSYWRIKRWIDTMNSKSDTSQTWSTLKAFMY